jgi:hypothetical protein
MTAANRIATAGAAPSGVLNPEPLCVCVPSSSLSLQLIGVLRLWHATSREGSQRTGLGQKLSSRSSEMRRRRRRLRRRSCSQPPHGRSRRRLRLRNRAGRRRGAARWLASERLAPGGRPARHRRRRRSLRSAGSRSDRWRRAASEHRSCPPVSLYASVCERDVCTTTSATNTTRRPEADSAGCAAAATVVVVVDVVGGGSRTVPLEPPNKRSAEVCGDGDGVCVSPVTQAARMRVGGRASRRRTDERAGCVCARAHLSDQCQKWYSRDREQWPMRRPAEAGCCVASATHK